MAVIDPDIEAAMAAVESGLAALRGADFGLLANADRMDVLERLERVGRTVPGIGHELVAELAAQGAVNEFPHGGMSPLLATTLNIRFGSSRRMLSEASQLADRVGVSGAVLPPVHPLVAPAQRAGLINSDHVSVILKFFAKLPAGVSAQDRQSAEEQLVEFAKTLRPDQLEAVARRLAALLNPDGSLDDERARRRDIGLWLGPQDEDGLTRGSFCIGARLRVFLEALFAKFAKPGVCNPEDHGSLIETGPVDLPPEPFPELSPEPPFEPPLEPPFEPVKRPRRPPRKCPTCGGDVGEDGKAATASEGDGVESPGEQGGGAGHCSGRGRGHGRGHGDRGGGCGGGRDDGADCGGDDHGGGRRAGDSGARDDRGDSNGAQGLDPPLAPDQDGPQPATQPDTRAIPAADAVTDAQAEQGAAPSSELDLQPELDLGLPPASTPAGADLRPGWLRNADALEFVLGSALSDPRLGQHRGLPVTAVVTMTLKELEAASGKALSGGGSIIPIREAIRMAGHAHPYLLIFDDDGRPLYLGRGKRLATADQRLVLYAGDRGCSHPGCPRPGYLCETHHIDEWSADNGASDIDRLTFACEMHHPLIGKGPDDWTTTKAPPGGPYGLRTLWHPPAFMDPLRRGRVNHFHHPDEYLRETPEFPGPDGEPPPQRE